MQTDQQLRELGIYGERKANLLKLATHLKTVPQEKFYMGTFFAVDTEEQDLESLYDSEVESTLKEPDLWQLEPAEEVHACGSVTCAIGRGPAAGIPVGDATGWHDYARENFVDTLAPQGDRAEDFLFSPDWQHIDITPMGVAKRIDMILKSGLECWPTNVGLLYFYGNLPYETE